MRLTKGRMKRCLQSETVGCADCIALLHGWYHTISLFHTRKSFWLFVVGCISLLLIWSHLTKNYLTIRAVRTPHSLHSTNITSEVKMGGLSYGWLNHWHHSSKASFKWCSQSSQVLSSDHDGMISMVHCLPEWTEIKMEALHTTSVCCLVPSLSFLRDCSQLLLLHLPSLVALQFVANTIGPWRSPWTHLG